MAEPAWQIREYARHGFEAMYLRLARSIVSLTRLREIPGEQILAARPDAGFEHYWRVPAIAPAGYDSSMSASVFEDIPNILHLVGSTPEWFLPRWQVTVDQIRRQDPSLKVWSGLSYPELAPIFRLNRKDLHLIFSTPDPNRLFSALHEATFALESAMFFAKAWGMELHRGAQELYVYTADGLTGVVDGFAWFNGQQGQAIPVGDFQAALRLPRGKEFTYWTSDTLDGVMAFLETTELPEQEFLQDCCALLRLGEAHAATAWLHTAMCNPRLALPRSTKFAGGDKSERAESQRRIRFKVTLEKRQADYNKVDEILADPGLVDRTKMFDMLNVLVPTYMTLSTFTARIGSVPASMSHAMFEPKRYARMMSGWETFRDDSLARHARRVEKVLRVK